VVSGGAISHLSAKDTTKLNVKKSAYIAVEGIVSEFIENSSSREYESSIS